MIARIVKVDFRFFKGQFHRNFKSGDSTVDSAVSHECVFHIVALATAQSPSSLQIMHSRKGEVDSIVALSIKTSYKKSPVLRYVACFANTRILCRANLKFLLQNFCVWLHPFLLNFNESAPFIRLSIYIYMWTKAETTKITHFTTSATPRWARARDYDGDVSRRNNKNRKFFNYSKEVRGMGLSIVGYASSELMTRGKGCPQQLKFEFEFSHKKCFPQFGAIKPQYWQTNEDRNLFVHSFIHENKFIFENDVETSLPFHMCWQAIVDCCA